MACATPSDPWGQTYVILNRSAIKPLGEAVSKLFRRLAAAMGYDEPRFKDSDEGGASANVLTSDGLVDLGRGRRLLRDASSRVAAVRLKGFL